MIRTLVAVGLSLALSALGVLTEPAHAQRAAKGQKVCAIKMKILGPDQAVRVQG